MKRIGVTVTIDRPKGYIDSFDNVYPINYGFVEGIVANDGEWQDAYILNEQEIIGNTFNGEVIAIIIREIDVEDKWVVAKKGTTYTLDEIKSQTNFIEQFFDSNIMLLD